MKILVTGGAGFIGSHIVDAYIAGRHEVTIVDDLSTGDRSNINPAAEFIDLDINDTRLDAVFAGRKFDVVNHHAAQINVRTSLADPLLDARINVLGSISVFARAAKHGVKRCIFASSGGAIYGEPENYPITEAFLPAPLSPYAAAKFSTENYLKVFSRLHGFDYVILRYSNVYGPRQISKSEAGVISIFINQILKKEKCYVNGDGNQVRDYVYVDDVVRANLLALTCRSDFFNIGTGVETSVNQLVDALSSVAGRPVEHEHRDPIPGEVLKNVLDFTKIKERLRWQPAVGLGDGLRRTFEYFSGLHAGIKKIS